MGGRASIEWRSGRRGTVYLIVLISVMIITIIGLSGVYASQILRRQVSEGEQMQAARAHAEASVEAGLALMEADPNWRQTYGNGDWFTNRPLGEGMLNLNVRDPDDGDVADSNLDPVVLRGTGVQAGARQIVEVDVHAIPGAVGALGSSAHAGRIMAFDGAKVTSDGVMTSNDSAWASGADVNGDVESAGTVIGSVFKDTVTQNADLVGMPIASSVVSTYEGMATPITMDEIATVSSNIAENGHVNFSKDNWSSYNCNIDVGKSSPYEGEGYLSVSSRSGNDSGPLLDLTSSIVNGRVYDVSLRVRASLATTMRAIIVTQDNDDELRSFTVGDALSVGSWVGISGTVTPTWDSGEGLKAAWLYVRTTSLSTSFDVDDVRVVPSSLEPPVIEEVAISPSRNPYGSGTTNADGVYSIDCAGADLVIRDCRIHGTLVLIDPGSGSLIEGSVHWTVPGADPALIVSGDAAIALSNVDLSESKHQVNFNPSGFGSGGEDDDASDSYASRIDGLVYVSNDLKAGNQTDFVGPVVAGRDLIFNGDDVKLTYDASYAADPPAGFVGASRMVLDNRSWVKVVD